MLDTPHSIHIHGTKIGSIDDLYEEILEQMPEKRKYFGYNLDALYDILSEDHIDRIVIHKSRYLKKSLDTSKNGGVNGRSHYYQFLDLLTDLDHVDIILQDD
jgi:RNAse (barnase) inhibitor barstar